MSVEVEVEEEDDEEEDEEEEEEAEGHVLTPLLSGSARFWGCTPSDKPTAAFAKHTIFVFPVYHPQ